MHTLTYVALSVSLIIGLLALFRGVVILFKYRSRYRVLALLTVLRGLVIVAITGIAIYIFYKEVLDFAVPLVSVIVLALSGAWATHVTEAKFDKELKGFPNSTG